MTAIHGTWTPQAGTSTEYGAAAHNTPLRERIIGRGATQTTLYKAAKPLWNFRSIERLRRTCASCPWSPSTWADQRFSTGSIPLFLIAVAARSEAGNAIKLPGRSANGADWQRQQKTRKQTVAVDCNWPRAVPANGTFVKG